MSWQADVAMVTVTAASAGISYLLFRTQVEREVVVFADSESGHHGMLNLIIANIGKGVAKHVSFTSSEPIPEGIVASRTVIEWGPLIEGIPALGPGARRVIPWGDVDSLMGLLGRRIVRVVASYESDNRWPWTGRLLTTESLVEVHSFNGTSTFVDPGQRTADSLAELVRMLQEKEQHRRITGAG